MRLQLYNRVLTIKLLKLSKWINGLSSLTYDNKNVLFFDFDNTNALKVRKILIKAQDTYSLSDVHVFKTSKNNYHAICLDKFSIGEIIDLHRNMTGYDVKHDKHSIPRGYWVLRFSEKRGSDKPLFLKTLKSKHKCYECSNAHRKFLNLKYDLRIKKLNNYDGYNNLIFDTYQTIL